MSKKNKNKPKKVSVKKERYSKFHKDKSGTLDISMPELSDEQTKIRREDDSRIDRFLKFSKNAPPKEIVARKEKSKR